MNSSFFRLVVSFIFKSFLKTRSSFLHSFKRPAGGTSSADNRRSVCMEIYGKTSVISLHLWPQEMFSWLNYGFIWIISCAGLHGGGYNYESEQFFWGDLMDSLSARVVLGVKRWAVYIFYLQSMVWRTGLMPQSCITLCLCRFLC